MQTWHQRLKYQLLRTYSGHFIVITHSSVWNGNLCFREKRQSWQVQWEALQPESPFQRCPVESSWAKPFALLNPFFLGWEREFTLSREPYVLMIALVSLYKRLIKQPTYFWFNGNLNITYSRKFPSERNYVFSRAHAFMGWKQSKKTGQLIVFCVLQAKHSLRSPLGRNLHWATHIILDLSSM